MIRVLVVDDSSVARAMIRRGLERCPDITVIGESPDVYDARDRIVNDDPDVITLDICMPRMDGVDFLTRLMPQYPKPVVIVSALDRLGAETVVLALEAGAVDVVAKPGGLSGRGLEDMMEELVGKVRSAARADVSSWQNPQWSLSRPSRNTEPVAQGDRDRIIAVGASTGGTVAIGRLLSDLQPTVPGIVISLHMPPIFTEKYAERLHSSTPFDVSEAKDGDAVRSGRVLIAPGDRHLEVVKKGRGYAARLADGPKVSGHRPSVDVLFASVAEAAGRFAIGVLLTGMGRDGATELMTMREVGARTIVQDEATSVVWGMPAEAVKMGAAEKILPIDRMGHAVHSYLGDAVI